MSYMLIALCDIIVISIAFISLIIYIIFNFLQFIYNKTFCVNCHKCKSYELQDVDSKGCWYICKHYGYVDLHDSNNKNSLRKCKKFE